MSSKFRNRSVSAKSRRVANAQDLEKALKRTSEGVDMTTCSDPDTQLPPQEPPFLGDMPPVGIVYHPQQPITKELKKIIDENYYGTFFEEAIKTVSGQHIPELGKIKTLDQYYFYLDTLVTWIPEIRVWEFDGELLHERTVYLRLTQFYYYFNQKELEALQSPIEPGISEKLSPISLWMRKFAVEWGNFLDTPESNQYLETFKYAPEFTWQDYEKAPEDYSTFNEFFARTFKDIERQRPVAQPNDDRVIVFPAESTFVGQWAITTEVGPPMPAPPSIVVKNIEWTIEELLADSEHKKAFEGGIFCHSFLNSYDYHRQHASVAGTIVEAKFIPGQVYLEVELTSANQNAAVYNEQQPNWEPINTITPRRYLDADDNTGYQFVQCRGLLVIDNPSLGKVAILPMGMAQVSSVVFVEPGTHDPIVLTPEEQAGLDYNQQAAKLNKKIHRKMVGKHLEKGEMISYFQFGGSDCVMVFERKANVNVTAFTNIHYPIRSQYAIANI